MEERNKRLQVSKVMKEKRQETLERITTEYGQCFGGDPEPGEGKDRCAEFCGLYPPDPGAADHDEQCARHTLSGNAGELPADSEQVCGADQGICQRKYSAVKGLQQDRLAVDDVRSAGQVYKA